MVTLPISFSPPAGLRGAVWDRITRFHSQGNDPIRHVERASSRAFMEKHRHYLGGGVLDYGSGSQPYRDLVGGEYVPFEPGRDCWPRGQFDAVICTQVLQYVDHPSPKLELLHEWLRPRGALLLTYPTNWVAAESSDLWRFTRAGMERLLKLAGFEIAVHELRAEVVIGNFHFALGYGAICTK